MLFYFNSSLCITNWFKCSWLLKETPQNTKQQSLVWLSQVRSLIQSCSVTFSDCEKSMMMNLSCCAKRGGQQVTVALLEWLSLLIIFRYLMNRASLPTDSRRFSSYSISPFVFILQSSGKGTTVLPKNVLVFCVRRTDSRLNSFYSNHTSISWIQWQ